MIEAVWNDEAWALAKRSASSRERGVGIAPACERGEICGIGAAGVEETAGVGDDCGVATAGLGDGPGAVCGVTADCGVAATAGLGDGCGAVCGVTAVFGVAATAGVGDGWAGVELRGVAAGFGKGAGRVGTCACKLEAQINANSTARGNAFGRPLFDIFVPWWEGSISGPTLTED